MGSPSLAALPGLLAAEAGDPLFEKGVELFSTVFLIVVLVYVLTFNVIDHSGVDLRSRLPWQGPSRFHDDHHLYFHVNFGQHLMIWDRLHGTLRRQKRSYGREVFGGKGVPISDEGKELPPFVEY